MGNWKEGPMATKSSLIAISLLGAFFLLPGCADDPPDGFSYPLALGNQWEYMREATSFFYSDSLKPDEVDSTRTYSSYLSVLVTGTEVLDESIETFVLRATVSDNEGIYQGEDYYYNNKEDGLYLYGYKGFGHFGFPVIIPKTLEKGERQVNIFFKGMYFNSVWELLDLFQQELPVHYAVRSDSIILEEPPVKVLHYPLETGVSWTYRTSGNPWRIDKHVEGEEQITVPAGEFVCYKIKWLYDIDDNGEWDTDIFTEDYIGQEGLVQRQMTLLGGIRMNANAEVVGYSDIKIKHTLETVSLEE